MTEHTRERDFTVKAEQPKSWVYSTTEFVELDYDGKTGNRMELSPTIWPVGCRNPVHVNRYMHTQVLH